MSFSNLRKINDKEKILKEARGKEPYLHRNKDKIYIRFLKNHASKKKMELNSVWDWGRWETIQNSVP
jgi:hypothetical protein